MRAATKVLFAVIHCFSVATANEFMKDRPPPCDGQICPSNSIQFSRMMGTVAKIEVTRSLLGQSAWKQHSHYIKPYPMPSPKDHQLHHSDKLADPKESLAKFYRYISALVDAGRAIRQQQNDGSTSTEFYHSTHYSSLKPSPPGTPGHYQPAKESFFRIADSLLNLLMKDVGFRARSLNASMSIRPTATFEKPIRASLASMDIDKTGSADIHTENQNMMRKFILHIVKSKLPSIESFMLQERVDMRNISALKHLVSKNLTKMADSYLKFLKMFLDFSKSYPCPGVCQRIEEMVTFCKKQHIRCNRDSSLSSLQPTVSLHDAPEKPCPSGTRRCPFQRECEAESSPCIKDMDLFLHTHPRPTASSKEPLSFASRTPNMGPQRPMANNSMLGFVWKEVAKVNSSMKSEGLQKIFDALRERVLGEGRGGEPNREQEQMPGKCARMCSQRNMTFCWSEMRCKRIGERCSSMHLALMMNRSAFEDQSKCREGFYCPVYGNCTRSPESCNPRIFMNISCDEECMRVTGGKGRAPSPEDVKIFRLKCKDGEKYCPRKFGCVLTAERCDADPKLEVPLEMGHANEKKVFCRMRDLLCPRVFKHWMRNKRMCESNNDNITMTIKASPKPTMVTRPTRGSPISASYTKPVTHSNHNSKVPGLRTSPSSAHRPTPPTSTESSGQNEPFITLKDYLPLRNQIKLPGRSNFVVVASMPCGSAFNFKLLTRSSRTGEEVVMPEIKAGNSQIRGVLLPLDAVLRFSPVAENFYGVCIIKYSVFLGSRPRLLQVAEVAAEQMYGSIALVVLPKVSKAEATLLQKRQIVEMNEDTKSPPCFKISDKLNVTKDASLARQAIPAEIATKLDSKVYEKYISLLAAQRSARMSIAVVSCEGHPWKFGTWKYRDGQSRMLSFPKECSRKRPFIIGLETCIAFYPREDFNGRLHLGILGAVTPTDIKISSPILGDRIVKIEVNVKEQPDAPELSVVDTCLPSLPFDLQRSSNAGFQVEDIIRTGNTRCGNAGGKKATGESLLRNDGRFDRTKVGLAIKHVSECGHLGYWEYKLPGRSFERVNIAQGGLALCLNSSMKIRFVPANYSKLWSIQQAMGCSWIKARVWMSLSHTESGSCNISGDANRLFSQQAVQMSVTRNGCDDVPGSMRQPDGCGRCGSKKISNIHCPCDGVPASGAVLDECGRCSGGTTRRVFHKRDCARKCYANGTQSENVVDACGRCQKRSFVGKDARDCNGDCVFGRSRACINKCGICVGGRTGKPHNQDINHCGVCKANATSACAKKLELVSEKEVNSESKFEIKMKAVGFSRFQYLSCTLEKSGGSPSDIIQIGKGLSRPFIQQKRTQQSDDLCEDPVISEYHVQIYTFVKQVGDYTMKCKIDGEGSDMAVDGGVLKVTSSSSSVQGIFPSEIDSCQNGSFVIKGSGFQNSVSLACGASCERYCDFKTKARFINESAIQCSIIISSNRKSCYAQMFNLHVLKSSAVRPPSFAKSSPTVSVRCPQPRAISAAFSTGMRRLLINLDKPASFVAASQGASRDKGNVRPSCESFFHHTTVEKLGGSRCQLTYKRIIINIAVGSILISTANGSKVQLTLNRENLKCLREEQYSVLKGERLQKVDISLPGTNIQAKISGQSSIGTCEKTTFNGIKSSGAGGGKLKYSWELLEKENRSTVVQAEQRRSWFKVNGKTLIANKEYILKLCVRNVFGQQNCMEKEIRTIDNHNSTMLVKILGDQQRKLKGMRRYHLKPIARVSQCQTGKKPTSMNFLWEVIGLDQIIVKNYEGRNLLVKPGDLEPGKNYTLKVVARATLDSGKVLTGESSIKVEVDGSPLKAKIRGGKKMTIGCKDKAVFDGRPSIDPDETSQSARYAWECTEEGGEPCFEKSNPTKRLVLEEKSRIELNADEILECKKSYVFKLTYSKGERQSSYSVNVNLKPGEPAEVKLDQKRNRKKIIVIGYIKTTTTANTTWSSIEQEGYTKLDLSDQSIVRLVGSEFVKVRGPRQKTFRRKFLVIDSEFLPEGEKYLIQLNATNEDGWSTAHIVVTTPSPPTKGEIIVEPANGTALNTSFTITPGDGWVQKDEEEIRYEIGYEMETSEGKKDVILRPFSEQNFIDGVQLPPGDNARNSTIKLYVKAKNSEGMTAKATIAVKVRQPEAISLEKTKDMLDMADQAIKERDMSKAVGLLATMAETAKSVTMDSPSDTSINEDLTKQVSSILEQSPSDETRQAALTVLESTTLPKEGVELKGETKESIGAQISRVFVTREKVNEPSTSRRRRRSAEQGTQSQETFTAKTKEEVDSTMTIFDNLIDEHTSGSYQDNLKDNFTTTVPQLLRSLCAGTVTTGDYLVSKSNLSTIRANRLPGFTFDSEHVNVSHNDIGPQVLLGSHFKKIYESWNCSKSGLQCTEVCAASVSYHYNMFPGEFAGRISDVVKIMLINPESYEIQKHETISPAVLFKMTLKEVPDDQHYVECRAWNAAGSNWTKDGCATWYKSGNTATCNCTKLKTVAVFKVQLPVVTTFFPPTTIPDSSPTQSMHRNGSQYISSNETNRPTNPRTRSNPSPIQTTGKVDVQLPIVVSFKFPVDFEAFSNKVDDLKKAIVDMLSMKLKISKMRIANLEVRAGSIIVTFTLLNNTYHNSEGNINEVKSLLVSMANNGTLNLVFDGKSLVAEGASLKFTSPAVTQAPTPSSKQETSSKTIIIVAVVSSIVLVVAVFILIGCYMKNRQNNQKTDQFAKSNILFADNIKLQERDPSPESMGTDNQRFLSSPNEFKSSFENPVATSPSPEEPRVVTPMRDGPPASDRSSAGTPGAMVSVGIGSSASLKKSLFNT
ncbi:uncharacterized protein LOC135690621 [Rhopilema esculentum]|uniref:uncharacterized protein LOC135690621 n=1 Tax=Rhopilema esculentum TaxID=499914 RepID=UPI0031D56150